jgi:hypothetical protein
MTTIAFDGTVVAADQGAWQNAYVSISQKLFRITINGDSCIAAAIGNHVLSYHMVEYIAGRGPLPNYRDCDGLHGDHSTVLLFYSDQRIQLVSANGWITPLRTTYGKFADGGGREMAMGALLAGASANRAIEICNQCSDYAAHGIQAMSLIESKF